MSKYKIEKEALEFLEFNEDSNELTIKWNTGGAVRAVNKVVLKVELVDKGNSEYTGGSDCVYDPSHDRAF
tara:strand:+ start:68 stop:277 length:210 start_codon:yes stop_codon:yes gene_type:complete